MMTHSSILAWKTPWTEEPGRLHSPWSCKSWTQIVVKIQESNDKLSISKSFLISFFFKCAGSFQESLFSRNENKIPKLHWLCVARKLSQKTPLLGFPSQAPELVSISFPLRFPCHSWVASLWGVCESGKMLGWGSLSLSRRFLCPSLT